MASPCLHCHWLAYAGHYAEVVHRAQASRRLAMHLQCCTGLFSQRGLDACARVLRMPALQATRFVRFCDALNSPLITLVDAPGFLLPLANSTESAAANWAAAIWQAAQLWYAYAEATVPKLTVIASHLNGSVRDRQQRPALRRLAYPGR